MANALAVFIIAIMAVAFAISFTALIYKGALAPFLGFGIVLSLISVIILGLLGAALFSFRGTICGPQDVTSILLGGSASIIAASMIGQSAQSIFQTVAVLVGSASVIAGIATYLCGRFKVGYLARFVPYPVIGGFLAATGYLLTISGLGMMVGTEISIWHLPQTLVSSDPARWLPWLLAACLIVFLTRKDFGDFTLPAVTMTCVLVFYIVLHIQGLSLVAAQNMGLLLGPFEDLSISGLVNFSAGFDVHWTEILMQYPTMIAIAGLTILGTLLSSTGLEMTLGKDSDFEADLQAAGTANAVAGLFGGSPGYQLLGETLLARNLGLQGRLPGISAALGALFALTFGASFLGYVPVGVLAMLITYLGIDLLVAWLWMERGRLNNVDYGIVVLIVAVAATLGFLQALAIGLLAAIIIFVISYAQLDMVRVRSTAATKRSRVERSDADNAVLEIAGQRTIILELAGYIFFGTANSLTKRVHAELSNDPIPETLVFDFSRLSGFDASAAFELQKIARECAAKSVGCVFAGLRPELAEHLRQSIPQSLVVDIAPDLDTALAAFETSALDHAETGRANDELWNIATRVFGRDSLTPALRILTLKAGEKLINEGSRSDEIFMLKEGLMRAETAGPSGSAVTVGRFQPGALMGEIAYYAGVKRTASLVAETDCTIYQVEPKLLIEDGDVLISKLDRLVATRLARRLIRATQLIKDAEI